MKMLSPSTLAISPLGTTEILIIAVLLLVLGLVVGGAVIHIIYLNKKK